MQYLKEAEDAIKTSAFKWTADHLTAATQFAKAGDILRAQPNQIELAANCYARSADSHDKVGNHQYASAQTNEKCARVYLQIGDLEKATKHFQLSAQRYADCAEIVKSAQALVFAAQSLIGPGAVGGSMMPNLKDIEKMGEENKKRATTLFMMAAERVQGIDKGHAMSLDVLRPGFSFMMKTRNYAKATEIAKQMRDTQKLLGAESAVSKLRCGICLLFIQRGDVVAARQQFAEDMNDDDYLSSDECEACEAILNAYENFDEDALMEAKKNQSLMFLERDFVTMVQDLKLGGGGGGGGGASKKQQAQMTAPSMMMNQQQEQPGATIVSNQGAFALQDPKSSSQQQYNNHDDDNDDDGIDLR